MPRKSVYDMDFERVYEALVAKAVRKGRSKEEVDACIYYLTGYEDVDELLGRSYGEFLSNAPTWNPRSEMITGSICGVRVESIEDPMEKRMRQLDKLVDELAKGRPMEKVLR